MSRAIEQWSWQWTLLGRLRVQQPLSAATLSTLFCCPELSCSPARCWPWTHKVAEDEWASVPPGFTSVLRETTGTHHHAGLYSASAVHARQVLYFIPGSEKDYSKCLNLGLESSSCHPRWQFRLWEVWHPLCATETHSHFFLSDGAWCDNILFPTTRKTEGRRSLWTQDQPDL